MSSRAVPFFLPGLICSDYVWSEQIRAFRHLEPGFVSGYGGADSITAMAEAVLAGAPRRLALAGHSMGARVALEIMRLAPERVERLALLDTGIHPVQPGEREKRMQLVALGRRQGMEALVDEWLPPMVHRGRREDDAFMAPLRHMAVSAGLAQFERQVGALLDRPDAGERLEEIDVPTLVGVGRDDEWSPPAQHEDIARRIRGAELAVFDDAGHMAPLEAPRQVNEALIKWLEK